MALSGSIERSAVGEGIAVIDRRIVERLRETDEELRARLRREALSNSGVPHFVDTRGPDLGLYTVDGMVLGGLLPKGAGQGWAGSAPTRQADTQTTVSGVAKPPVQSEARPAPKPVPVSAPVPRGVAAYASHPGSAVGGAKDLKI